jgi:hypothetical protein
MPEHPAPVPKECYSGYIKVPAASLLQVDFTAPVGATEAVKDSAFLEALSSVEGVEFDYLSLGEVVDHNGMHLVADPFQSVDGWTAVNVEPPPMGVPVMVSWLHAPWYSDGRSDMLHHFVIRMDTGDAWEWTDSVSGDSMEWGEEDCPSHWRPVPTVMGVTK